MGKRKRYRTPKAKENQLLVQYGQQYGDKDLYYCWTSKEHHMGAECRIVSETLERCKVFENKTLRQILEERGYDITTLKFSIMKKEPQDDN